MKNIIWGLCPVLEISTLKIKMDEYLSHVLVDSSEVSLTVRSGAFDRMEGTFSFLGVID